MARNSQCLALTFRNVMRMVHTKKYNVMVPQGIVGALMKMEIKRKEQKLSLRNRTVGTVRSPKLAAIKPYFLCNRFSSLENLLLFSISVLLLSLLDCFCLPKHHSNFY